MPILPVHATGSATARRWTGIYPRARAAALVR